MEQLNIEDIFNQHKKTTKINFNEKIQKKFVKYGLKIEQMTKFGQEIQKTGEMMTTITTASDEFIQELEKYEVWREEIYDNQLP